MLQRMKQYRYDQQGQKDAGDKSGNGEHRQRAQEGAEGQGSTIEFTAWRRSVVPFANL